MNRFILAAFAGACLAGISAGPSVAASGLPPSDPLYQTILAQDKAVFAAYNSCDLNKFASYFPDDVEFYHDKGGLTRGKADLVSSVRKYICGKVTRELEIDTLEIYPMDNFGALEIGTHRFRHPSDPNEKDGLGKFVEIWQNQNGAWKLVRVISYDHVTAPD